MSERIPRHSYLEDPLIHRPLNESIQAPSKPSFKKLLATLREKVQIEELLVDRLAQAKLDILLNLYAERSERGDNLPLVMLKTENDGSGRLLSVQPCRFQLADRKYLYYFDQQWPREEMPSYLRPEDVVTVEDFRVEGKYRFTKTVNRVAISGGSAELFDNTRMTWEENGQGFFAGIEWKNRRQSASFS